MPTALLYSTMTWEKSICQASVTTNLVWHHDVDENPLINRDFTWDKREFFYWYYHEKGEFRSGVNWNWLEFKNYRSMFPIMVGWPVRIRREVPWDIATNCRLCEFRNPTLWYSMTCLSILPWRHHMPLVVAYRCFPSLRRISECNEARVCQWIGKE